MSLKDDDIAKLFDRIAEHFKDADDKTHEMFSILVTVALRFRDQLMKETGVPLTVGETQKALDAFMKVLKTHQIPPSLDKNIHDLLIMWLEEVKTKLHH